MSEPYSDAWLQELENRLDGILSKIDMLSGRVSDQHEILMELKERIEALEEGMERLGPIIGHRNRK